MADQLCGAHVDFSFAVGEFLATRSKWSPFHLREQMGGKPGLLFGGELVCILYDFF